MGKFRFTILVYLIAGLLSLARLAPAAGPACAVAFYQLALPRITDFDPRKATPVHRFPVGVDQAANPRAFFQYGFESEYQIDEAAPLLEIYGPDPNHPDAAMRMPTAEWLVLPPADRMRWVQEKVARRPEFAEESGLVRVGPVPAELNFLPEKLVMDPTGNLEIVLPPVETLEEWYQQITRINQRFGVGSMQAMISGPGSVYFGNGAAAAKAENLGYLNFIHDYDVIEKLDAGADRYKRDPSKRVANAFAHPFLGPITERKRALLEDYLTANATGGRADRERDLKPIRSRDDSFKYIGSTAYRPDIGMPHSLVAMEVRDAHKNFDLLLERVLRTTQELGEHGTSHAPFARVIPFDSVRDFEKLPEASRKMLEKLFPSKARPDAEYTPDELVAVEVYRNFAFPLRDWSVHLEVFHRPELAARVRLAQERYVQSLSTIAQDLEAARIEKEPAAVKVQGALALFVQESGIAKTFRDWQRLNPTSDKAYNRYLNLVVRNLGPLKEAFPIDLWDGRLEKRFGKLAAQYPRNVALRNDTVIVSTAGLSPEEQRTLRAEYLNAVGRGSISMPAGAQSSPVRFGVKTFTIIDNHLSNAAYEVPAEGSETVVELSPIEELRLRYGLEKTLARGGAAAGADLLQAPATGEARVKRTIVFTTQPIGE